MLPKKFQIWNEFEDFAQQRLKDKAGRIVPNRNKTKKVKTENRAKN
jgi:hypothetical protein